MAIAVSMRLRPPADVTDHTAPSSTFSDASIRTVHGPEVSQEEVFASIAKLRKNFLQDHRRCVVFAYGQTGSGKTHTVLGPPGVLTEHTLAEATASDPNGVPPEWGIFPRTALETFRHAIGSASNPNNAILKCSAVEVYMDRVYDLLNNREQVQVQGMALKQKCLYGIANNRMQDENGVWMQAEELKKIQKAQSKTAMSGTGACTVITSEAEIAQVARLIEATRSATKHNMNERSSRSHCLITLTLEELVPSRDVIQTSTFSFVDLAGSERINKSGVQDDARGGATSFSLKGNASMDIPASRLDEARNVNSSLGALSRLMVAMSQGQQHLPFRDSGLNLMLKPFFGDVVACRAHLILSLRSEDDNAQESLSTIRFGKVVASVRSAGGGGAGGGAFRRSHSVAGGGRRSSQAGTVITSQERRKDRNQRLEQELQEAQSALKALEATGDGGHMLPGVDPPTIRQFESNKKALDEATEGRVRWKQELSELKSTPGTALDDPKVLAMAEKVKDAEHKIWVYKGLVARMINAGVWQPPSKRYQSRERQVESILQQLNYFQ